MHAPKSQDLLICFPPQFSHDRGLVASCSHDEVVKFWDVSYLTQAEEESDGEEEGKDDEVRTLNFMSEKLTVSRSEFHVSYGPELL